MKDPLDNQTNELFKGLEIALPIDNKVKAFRIREWLSIPIRERPAYLDWVWEQYAND